MALQLYSFGLLPATPAFGFLPCEWGDFFVGHHLIQCRITFMSSFNIAQCFVFQLSPLSIVSHARELISGMGFLPSATACIVGCTDNYASTIAEIVFYHRGSKELCKTVGVVEFCESLKLFQSVT